MKLKISILLVLSIFICASSYTFNYGKDTYETVDNILIVNSLGDQYQLSEYGALGINDFIPENAVKNYLALDGYTTAYDYNPTVSGSQFAEYRSKPPQGQDYTKMSFAGLLGDPRTEQDVYVLTSEYNRLNAKQQAIRMDDIEQVNDVQDTSINTLQTDLQNETSARITGDKKLKNKINKVDKNSKLRDGVLQNNINTVDSNSVARDGVLQNNINTVDSNSVARDSTLDNRLTNINRFQSSWNRGQDTRLDGIDSTLLTHGNMLNDHENRLNTLEETQYNIRTELEFIRERNLTVGVYTKYNINRNKCSEIGVSFRIGIGKSWEERELDEVQQQLRRLENKLNRLQ